MHSHRAMPDIDFEAEHDPERAQRRSRMRLLRYAKNHGIDVSDRADATATSKVDRAASESGAPLPGDLRERFESSLGADLSSVRVHTGAASASAAESVGAKAYATGQDIHFGAGEYNPSSKDGQHLLAHEVAHTVQQGSASTAQPQAKLEVSGPGDAQEDEADRAADAMIAGVPASVPRGSAGVTTQGILRKPVEDRLLTGPGLKPPDPISTGDPLADKGLGCAPIGDNATHGPCFLGTEQRRTILANFQGDVHDAYTAYIGALNQVRTDELLKKDIDTSQWMFDVFLDVISFVGISSIKAAIRAGTGATNELAQLATDPQRAINELSTVTEAQMEKLLTSTQGRGRQINTQKQDAEHAKANPEKLGVIEFLDIVAEDADQRFKNIRKVTPAGASDSELVFLARAYRSGHTLSDYKAEIEKLVRGFKKVGVSKLGVHQNDALKKDPTQGVRGDQDPESHWQIATAAFWVQTPIGRRLALYQRGYNDVPKRMHPLGGGISHATTQQEAEQFKKEDLRTHPFVFYKFIPKELIDAAVQMHVARWGAKPEEHPMGAAEFQAMAWDQEL